MDIGWKTILGGCLFAIGQILGAAMSDCPVEAWVPWLKWFAGIFNAGGMILGAVGISSKMANSTNAIVNATTMNRSFMAGMIIDKNDTRAKVIEKRVPYVAKIINTTKDQVVFTKENIKPDLNSGECIKSEGN